MVSQQLLSEVVIETEMGMETDMEDMDRKQSIAFVLRVIQNQIKSVIHKSFPRCDNAPQSQLQGGILGYLFHHTDGPVYQRDIEKEFRISGATATNTLQVMEKNGLIVRKSQDKDARLKRIVMTEPACKRHAQVEAHMQLMDKRMLQGMTEAEVLELFRLLGKLLENLEQMERESVDIVDIIDREEKQKHEKLN